MLLELLEDVAVFLSLLLPSAHASVLVGVSILSKSSTYQRTGSLRLRCARRFCIRLRSMASGSVRGPDLVLDDAFTIVYTLYRRVQTWYFEMDSTRLEKQDVSGTVGCSQLMN